MENINDPMILEDLYQSGKKTFSETILYLRHKNH